MTTITNNPFECGKKLKTGFDYFAKGFCKNELVDAHYRLIADRRQAQLLLECASFEEIDDFYNPGEYDDESDRLTTDMVLEAVRVRQFGQTAKTMAALQRVLNKHLAATGKLVNDEPMFAGDAIIGKPKKSGLFASVTVQFPINDGQTLSIIFHSPDNNKMKITAADEIIAFRWLLNKRDITSAVAPDSAEEGTLPGMTAAKDVSLEEVGIRCAQLIAKNSDRFAAKSAEIQQAKKELEDIKGQVDQLQGKNSELQDNLAAMQNDAAKTDSQIAATQKQLDAQVLYNEELRAKLDALKANNAGNAGKNQGEDTTGGVSKADQEAAEFEVKRQQFADELSGRGFKRNGPSDVMMHDSGLSAILHINRDVTFSKRPKGFEYVIDLSDPDVPADKKKIGGDKSFACADLSGLDAQITKALAWIDKKLGEMKKVEEPTGITEADFESLQSDFLDVMAERGAKKNDAGTYSIIKNSVEITGNLSRQSSTMVAVAVSAYNDTTKSNERFYHEGITDAESARAIIQQLGEWLDGQIPADVDNAVKVNDETPAGDTTDEVSTSLATLDDILNGKYQTSDEIMPLLEQVAEVFERLALAEDSPEMKKLDHAADYMTAILDKEAA